MGGGCSTIDGPRDWAVQVSGTINRLAVSPDGVLISESSDDQSLRVYDSSTERAPQSLRGHSGAINGVAFSPDGGRVVSASDDGTVKVWPTVRDSLPTTLASGQESALDLQVSPDRQWIAVGDRVKLMVFSTATGEAATTIAAPAEPIGVQRRQ